jgi:hypothetical protein
LLTFPLPPNVRVVDVAPSMGDRFAAIVAAASG